MEISKRKEIVLELARNLSRFLPAKDREFSFVLAAHQVDLDKFFEKDGDLRPAVEKLLIRTLNYEKDKFLPLIESIVGMSVNWRDRQGKPLEKAEVIAVVLSLKSLGLHSFKLNDKEFQSTLRQVSESDLLLKATKSAPLIPELMALTELAPVERGFEFERFLQRLFIAFDLDPKPSFRNVGEQVDGSFNLDSETYLIEARWRNKVADFAALAAFSAKVSSKVKWARGIFISYNGFSPDGLTAFGKSDNKNLVLMDGFDIYEGLNGRPYFDELLRKKVRRAAEKGEFFISARDI